MDYSSHLLPTSLDAAIDAINERMSIGLEVRDHEGFVIAAKCLSKMGHLELVTKLWQLSRQLNFERNRNFKYYFGR